MPTPGLAPSPTAPPDLPSVHADQALVNYLRRFSSWSTSQMAALIPRNQAIFQFFMMSPSGAVFVIGIDDDGRLTTAPVDLGSGAVGTPVITFAPVTGYAAASTPNPTGTNNATYTMMGLALPLTGEVGTAAWVTADGQITNTANNGETDVVICYGTGAAPVNGAPQTGTIVGQPTRYVSTAANDYVPFSLTVILTSLARATTYWVDLALKANGGTARVMDLDFSAHGLA
jgi:hypothetical protein